MQQHLKRLEDQSGSEPEHVDMLKTAMKRKENVTERKNEEETRKCSREE